MAAWMKSGLGVEEGHFERGVDVGHRLAQVLSQTIPANWGSYRCAWVSGE